MKLAKDVVNNQPSDATMATIVASLKSLHTTHIAFSVPMNSNVDFIARDNNPNPRTVEQFTAAWANAIHNAGLGVLWRGTFSEFEIGGNLANTPVAGAHTVIGLYNFPFYVAGDPANGAYAGGMQTQQWWLNKMTEAITRLASYGAFKSGDIFAPLPEPQSNHNFWDTKWNFLGINNQPDVYGSFFTSLKSSEDNAFASARVPGIITGWTSDNGSMFLSAGAGGGHWYPLALAALISHIVTDHYGSDGCGGYPVHSAQEMDCGPRDMYSNYRQPIAFKSGPTSGTTTLIHRPRRRIWSQSTASGSSWPARGSRPVLIIGEAGPVRTSPS